MNKKLIFHRDFEVFLEKLAPEKPYSQYHHNGYLSAMMVKELKPNVLDGRKWVYYQSPVFDIDEQEAERFDEGLKGLDKKR